MGTAQRAQFWEMRIISGTNHHPKDLPFVHAWVLMGNVRFGRYKPTQKTNFGDRCSRGFAESWRKSKQADVGVARCATLSQ